MKVRDGMTVNAEPFDADGICRGQITVSKFFINRPIVAMVISILMVIAGVVAMLGLPTAQFPKIAPPEIQVQTTYLGADAETVAQSVATPIEQQMAGVDNMQYMYSLNGSDGSLKLTVNFDIATETNTDQILSQMRTNQATSQLPSSVTQYGVTVQKSTSAPLMLVALYSPHELLRQHLPGELRHHQYQRRSHSCSWRGIGHGFRRRASMPCAAGLIPTSWPAWQSPFRRSSTLSRRRTRSIPRDRSAANRCRRGRISPTLSARPGRLPSAEEFGEIIVRAQADGGILRLKDVARIELGAQTYALQGRLNGKPAALLAIYQLPGTNAVKTAAGVRKLMEEAKTRFPQGLDYVIPLDTTLAVTEGLKEIQHTLFEAIGLVILVVFIFLQGWRATLIPLLAVPVSLVGTFIIFPMLGFSINTLSLFGLVLAIGLVVDDAIVVVEAVEHHIEHGLSPKEATLKAMEEVSGPVIAIALILSAVFVPTAFIPGITGRMYQQFAVTIAVSVIISAFNALTLSPALSAMLLQAAQAGPRARWQNSSVGSISVFGRATDGYVSGCAHLIRKGRLGVWHLAGAHVGARVLRQEDSHQLPA